MGLTDNNTVINTAIGQWTRQMHVSTQKSELEFQIQSPGITILSMMGIHQSLLPLRYKYKFIRATTSNILSSSGTTTNLASMPETGVNQLCSSEVPGCMHPFHQVVANT